ncbi:hypothetical protein NEIG_01323 [Nematocida sp. ERTm5]|nr:hypothetical protein NEIRO02_1004 [Nematocida sp. AWRm79]KAI5183388.1 hypothetical protein NEIRO03_0985 [Nematocida sp. AWRm78]OAG32085.1 hypothetical protein NEIG_01323 [Nematocida sp. ERTm5]
MYIGEYSLYRLERQFRYTYLLIRNLFVYRIHKKSVVSTLLDIFYNILVAISIFTAMESLIFFFFGSLPIYSFSEVYYRVRPNSFYEFDKSIKQTLFFITVLFCVLFEIFVQFSVFYRLVLGYFAAVSDGSVLNYIGGALFYSILIGCSFVLHDIIMSYMADALDLIKIKTLTGKIVIGCIITGLVLLMDRECRFVYKTMQKRKKRTFSLLFYMSTLIICIIMMLIWFGIDLGIPMFSYMLKNIKSEVKSILS